LISERRERERERIIGSLEGNTYEGAGPNQEQTIGIIMNNLPKTSLKENVEMTMHIHHMFT